MDDLSSRLTISHLRLVVAIAEEHSLVGAAKRMNMTQPAVTKALQVAEALLRVTLFSRTSAGMVPTLYGEALTAQARIILSQLGQAGQHLSDLRDGGVGRVIVGSLSAPTAVLLPTAIALLRKEKPNIIVNVVEGTNDALIPALRRGDVDMVVGRLPNLVDHSVLTQEELFQEIVSIVARPDHPLFKKQRLTLAEVAGWDWILPPEGTLLRQHIDNAFRRAELEPPSAVVESRSLQLTHSLLLQSDYLAAWPWQVVALEIAEQRLKVAPVTLTPERIQVGVTSRADLQMTPAALHLVEMMRTVSTQLQAQSDEAVYYLGS